MSITSPKGTFGIASFLILCLIGSLYYAYDKTNAYNELQGHYHDVKNGDYVPVENPINKITPEETQIAKDLIQGSFDEST